MISTQLRKLADQNNWRTNAEAEIIFGDYNGYLFTVLEGKGFKAFFTPIAGISREGLKSMTRFLNEHHKSLRLRNYELGDNFLCIRQQESLIPLSADKMEFMLAQISGLLSLYELPAKACAVCGRQADTRGLYFDLFCHLHPECESGEMVDFTRMTDDEPSGSRDDPDQEAEDDAAEEVDAAEDFSTVEDDAAEEVDAPAIDKETDKHE